MEEESKKNIKALIRDAIIDAKKYNNNTAKVPNWARNLIFAETVVLFVLVVILITIQK